ncbi:DUF3331 domain-containing protein [Cupriavidus agavae]|uniref:Uncharacterized protein DUF3331 n=1 Tax=Cupriavidus agavae TaxID=1001822 RepID=A0A4Q7S095_9BURK|nr:DUF3331 domain-containing protein [Cupriavidus agavae]RZT39513.1 uncharacterized protein DUF3331 [Cupriavidus agavae]
MSEATGVMNPAAAETRDAPFDSSCEAWLRTIALLEPQQHTLTYTAEDHAGRAHAPIVTVIERPSTALAVVSWRDATHCRYGEQIWAIGTAREPGICALTGLPIPRLATVYRPQRTRPAPLNAEAMILASAIENCCGVTEPARDPQPAFRYRSR